MTDEQVISEEQRKIREILNSQFAQTGTSDNIINVPETKDTSKHDMELMNDEVISKTFDEIKTYTKAFEGNKETVESLKDDIATDKKHSRKHKSISDEL